MRIGDRYADANDANQQLHNTLVELDGELCHIEMVEGWKFSIRKVITDGKKRRWSKKVEHAFIKDMDLNLQQFKLGYVNYMGKSYYLKRKPLRKWKQGFYHDYMRLIKNDVLGEQPNPMKIQPRNQIQKRGSPDMSNIFHSQAMVDLYDDNYPSFARAWIMVSLMDKESVAWHRHWSFAGYPVKKNRRYETEFCLLYKGKIVGTVRKGDVFLKHEFRYLTETFVEAMIHASEG